MLLDSQGQPQALLIKDQQFISFFCHGHLFQLKRTAHGLHAPLSNTDKMDKMVSESRPIFIHCAKLEEMESALIICVFPPSHTLSTVHRGHHLLHPALSVQEEECEAHRRCDAAGGPARYEQMEAV